MTAGDDRDRVLNELVTESALDLLFEVFAEFFDAPGYLFHNDDIFLYLRD